ncbi:MAG: hypothetical protein SNH63_07265 [Rikenellaceae bacterium]
MKRRLVKNILIVVCGCIFVMCAKDADVVDSVTTTVATSTGNTSLKLSFSPEDAFTISSSSDTRATTEMVVENELINLWILLFDQDSNRIVPFNPYNEDGELSYELYDAEGNPLTVFDDAGKVIETEAYDALGQTVIIDCDDEGNFIDQIYCADGKTLRQGIAETDELYGSTYLSTYESKQTIYVNKALSAKIRHIRAVANTMTTNAYFSADSCATLSKYNDISFRLSNNAYRESDMWNEFNDVCYLRMAGFWDGVIAETGLDFNIAVLAKPIAAKVTVAYECFDEEVEEDSGLVPSTITVTSVQITRVPQNCYYHDVEDELEAHDHSEYTSYQPRYVYDVDYLSDKTGEVSFYVPQNLKGTAGSSSSDIAPEDEDLSPESLKTLYHAHDATCVIITGLYKYWDYELSSMEKKYVYIQLYPGDNSYDNYDVKLRHEYHLNCTITAEADTVKWNLDYRVTLSEVLPEGAIVHYEFDPDNLSLNSAYDQYNQLLGSYPRETGLDDGYREYLDNYRKSANLTDGTRTKNSYYYTGYTDENGDYHTYSYADAGAYDLHIDDLSDYYDRYFYGFTGTTNAIAARYTEEYYEGDTLLIQPFLRNLAVRSTDERYNNEDGHNPYYRLRSHPEIFNCTLIKDNFKRYYNTTLTSGYTSGELQYHYPNNYINSSFLQLNTGWGAGLKPDDEEFTIVFIGSLGVNSEMGNKRGVYYGNSIEWNKRWYFYKNDTGTSSNITYGFGTIMTSPIDALYSADYDNVQSYDICNKGFRKVYFNNVDVEGIQAETSVSLYHDESIYVKDRPSTSEFIFDAPISVFGHTTDDNKDDAIDGKLRLFLIYDRVLDLDDIDQIRRYAALKGLLLYGVEDYDGFDVKVSPMYETAWDTEIVWNDGGGDSVDFGTAESN